MILTAEPAKEILAKISINKRHNETIIPLILVRKSRKTEIDNKIFLLSMMLFKPSKKKKTSKTSGLTRVIWANKVGSDMIINTAIPEASSGTNLLTSLLNCQMIPRTNGSIARWLTTRLLPNIFHKNAMYIPKEGI
jgi:hypothetical protein